METELERSASVRLAQKVLSLVAVIFGIVTIIAGTRVLIGSDPGYKVFLPLLVYNTVMGIVYIGAGTAMWVNLKLGKYAAATIFAFNIFVLGIIGYLYTKGSYVALESVLAMTFRTIVWFVLFIGLTWVCRRKILVEEQHA